MAGRRACWIGDEYRPAIIKQALAATAGAGRTDGAARSTAGHPPPSGPLRNGGGGGNTGNPAGRGDTCRGTRNAISTLEDRHRAGAPVSGLITSGYRYALTTAPAWTLTLDLSSVPSPYSRCRTAADITAGLGDPIGNCGSPIAMARGQVPLWWAEMRSRPVGRERRQAKAGSAEKVRPPGRCSQHEQHRAPTRSMPR